MVYNPTATAAFYGDYPMLQFANAMELNSYTEAVDGQRAYTVDEGLEYRWLAVLNRWVGASGSGSTTIVIAASDSTCSARADYVCDGVDDQVQIKVGIDALPDSGGRVVLLEGTYYISSTISLLASDNNDYVVLEGQGPGTILKIPNDHSATMNVVHAWGNSGTLQGVTVKNLRIDGNRANVTGAYYNGVAFSNVVTSTIDGIYISNGKGDGVGNGYGLLVGGESSDIVIRNCDGRDWDFQPLEIRASSRVTVTGCRFEYRIELYDTAHYVTFTNNSFIDMQLWIGTDTSTGSFCKQIKVNDNYFYTTSDRGTGYITLFFNRAIGGEAVGNQLYLEAVDGNGIGARYGGHHLIANNYFYMTKMDLTAIYNIWNYSDIIGNYFYHAHSNHGIGLEDGIFNNIINNYSYNLDPSIHATSMIRLKGGANFNTVKDNFCSSGGDCIYVASDNNQIIGNRIAVKFNRGINLSGDANRVTDNDIAGIIAVAAIVDSGAGNTFARNVGYVTEKSGTATVVNGDTDVTVAHGLDVTPSINDINVVPTNNLGNAAKFWISNVTNANFKINVNADPGVATATFSWQVATY